MTLRLVLWCGGEGRRWSGGQLRVDTADTEPELASCLASAPPEPLAASPLCWTQIRGPAPGINSTAHTRAGRRTGAAIFKVNLRIGFKVIVLPFFFLFFFCLQKHTFRPIFCGNVGQPKLFKMTKKGAKIVVDQKGHQRSSFFCTSLQRGYSISESMT